MGKQQSRTIGVVRRIIIRNEPTRSIAVTPLTLLSLPTEAGIAIDGPATSAFIHRGFAHPVFRTSDKTSQFPKIVRAFR
jgi:hypothetical protein